MSPEELFTMALGLTAPWHVKRAVLSVEVKELDLYIDFEEGGRFPCPQCQQACPAYDSQERTWRHLNFFEYKTVLHARLPRVQCSEHGVLTVVAPWTREGSGFTLLFEAMALLLCREMSPHAAAKQLQIQDTRLWRLVDHHVTQARQEQDLAQVREIGLDEVARREGQDYLTIGIDHDQQRVIAVASGRDEQAVAEVRQQLEAHGAEPERIKAVSRDLLPSVAKGVAKQFPQAISVADPFHVSQMVHDALDQTRRQEVKTQPGLRGSRYLWLKGRDKLNDKELARLQELESLPLQTACAYRLKEEFHALWKQPEAREARAFLTRWHERVAASDAGDIFKHMADNLLTHIDEIVAYHQTGCRVSNGISEAINGLIDSLKARARGFRSTLYLTNMIFLTQGKLDFALPTINSK